jgi:hypothetical protein
MLWSQVMHQLSLRAAGSSFSRSLQFWHFGLPNGCGERALRTCESHASRRRAPSQIVRAKLGTYGLSSYLAASRGTFQVFATSFAERTQCSKTYSHVGACQRD